MISRRRKSTPLPLITSATSTTEVKRKYSATRITQYIVFLLALASSFTTIGYTIGQRANLAAPCYAKSSIEFAEWAPSSDWETWSYHDIHKKSCEDYKNDHPVPSLEYWNYLRTKYNQVVDPTYKFDDKVPPTQGYSTDSKGTPPFYYAKASPGKGRGIYASRDIKKGEAFDDGTYVGTIFPDGMAYRRFLFSLPKDMACDATMWTWTQQFFEGGPYNIIMAFEISALMNSSLSKAPNAVSDSKFSTVDTAQRDIKKDEEILTDYHRYPTRWGLVGLGRKTQKTGVRRVRGTKAI